MDTSDDAPYLDCAYKLQEYAGAARRKRSEGKATWPGRKQVFRHYDQDGCMVSDTLTVESDKQDGEALIKPVMKQGTRLGSTQNLTAIRQYAAVELARLPMALRTLAPFDYPVEISPGLQQLAAEVDSQLR